MMLFGENKYPEGCNEYMYEGQQLVQTVCVLVALLCIPWMLIGKPVWIMITGDKGGHVI
jgi:V-type H+-transporting ATPase subunit a